MWKCSKRLSVLPSLSRLTLKFKKVTLLYSGRAALPNNTAASILLLLLFSSSHSVAVPSPRPSPLHFVATVTLTLNSQVGRCRGRDTEAVARTAGVFPSILRLDPEDDEGAVDENAHSELQITARRHRGFYRTMKHASRSRHLFFPPFLFFLAELRRGAIREQQRVKQQLSSL